MRRPAVGRERLAVEGGDGFHACRRLKKELRLGVVVLQFFGVFWRGEVG
jgi:hypothetical protein